MGILVIGRLGLGFGPLGPGDCDCGRSASSASRSGPIQALYDYVDSNGPATDLDARIVSITISDERAASVVLHADPWHGKNFTDHFHLLKIDGAWKILSKIFSHD